MPSGPSPRISISPGLERQLLPFVVAGLGLALVSLSVWRLGFWMGMGLASAPLFLSEMSPARNRAATRLAAVVAWALLGLGLLLVDDQPAMGMVVMLTGLGWFGGWLPFDWGRRADDANARDEQATFDITTFAGEVVQVTAAIVALMRLSHLVVPLAPGPALVVLFLAAALSLGVGAARVWIGPPAEATLRLAAAMALCEVVAEAASLNALSPLPITAIAGRGLGLMIWLHAAAVLAIRKWVRSPTRPSGRRPVLTAAFAAADLAGAPPLPGFWLRGALLLLLISRQNASNVTGEFEPNAGMLTLAGLFALAWGALMAAWGGAMFDPPSGDEPASDSPRESDAAEVVFISSREAPDQREAFR